MVTVRAQFQGQIHVLCSLLTFTMTSIALELYTKLAAAGQTGTLPSRCFPRSLSFPPRPRGQYFIVRNHLPWISATGARTEEEGREGGRGASLSIPSSAIKAVSTRGSGEEEEVINPGNGRRRRSRRRRRRKRHEQRK